MKTLSALFVKETELTYEPGRDAIASVTNRVGLNHDKLLSQYGYAINADGQRISRTTTHGGETFTDAFGFDPDTGGLISSKRAASVDADHTYAFDKIGNREVTVSGAETPITYQPNALNQYLSIEGDSSIALTHDADGNLTRRGDRTFTWDADNRLIAIHERGILIARYTYDHQSRRIARWTRDGVDERYLYQGWNLIAVYRPGETEPVETYTWGKDLSGSLQGAGGVGGLLFAKKRGHGKDAWIYHFDANGNVTEVTDSKGNLLDHYEYDPFGQLRKPPLLPENRCRFSTKPQDVESGFYYYGHRYYDPVDGRWLSRDPIEEQGGVNLYRFVENNPLDAVDPAGLDAFKFTYTTRIETPTVSFLGRTFNGGRKTHHIVDIEANLHLCGVTNEEISIGSTTEYDSSGAVIGTGTATGSTISVWTELNITACKCTVNMSGNEGNPLVPQAPGITYKAEINILMKPKTVDWKVEHDKYPSHYFSGPSSLLYSFSHVKEGTSPASLFPPFTNATGSGSFNY